MFPFTRNHLGLQDKAHSPLADQSMGNCVGHHVRAVPRSRLQADMIDMTFHRSWSDVQLLGDLLGGKACCDARQHLYFSRSQPKFGVVVRLNHRKPPARYKPWAKLGCIRHTAGKTHGHDILVSRGDLDSKRGE